MRKTFSPVGSTLLLALTLCTGNSCKNTTQAATSEADTTTTVAKVDTLVTSPAYTFATKQDSTIDCSFEVDYPQLTDSLALGVREFIAKELARVYVPYTASEDAPKGYPLYKGSLDKAEALVKHYAEGSKRFFVAEQKEMMSETADNDWQPRFHCDVKVKKVAETPNYVTYGTGSEVYLGGAHGSYFYQETNISKRTFQPVSETVDTTKVMAMQPLLRKGVIEYLKDCGVENAEKDYKSHLFLPDDGHIPLPTCTPTLTAKGVSFGYQQYEIASYAVGLVSFTISYDDIKPYLTKEALELIK